MSTTPVRFALIALLVPLAAAGCAAELDLPPLPEDHPANPAAAAAPYARPSGVLEGAASLPAAEPEPMQGHENHGGGMEAPAREAAGTETVYTCPMHPEVRSAEPGTCPVCGMELEAVEPAPRDDPEPAPHRHRPSSGGGR